MAALTDEQRLVLMASFHMRGFNEMFSIIEQYYKQYNLGQDMTDDEKIAEFQYINEQLRKFAFTKQDQILEHGSDLDSMLEEVDNLISQSKEYADTRKVLMYNFMRDAWLIELHNNISYLIGENSEEDE